MNSKQDQKTDYYRFMMYGTIFFIVVLACAFGYSIYTLQVGIEKNVNHQLSEVRASVDKALALSESEDLRESVSAASAKQNVRLEKLESYISRVRKSNDGKRVNIHGEGPWGVWGGPSYCPINHYVCGLEQKLEPRQGDGDDTSLNGVRMICCPF